MAGFAWIGREPHTDARSPLGLRTQLSLTAVRGSLRSLRRLNRVFAAQREVPQGRTGVCENG